MRQKGDVKEKILRESMKLFLDKGFYGASTNELVRLAGVSKGALYWHFKDKEDILHHILDRFNQEFLKSAISEVEDCPGGFIDKFKIYYKFTTEFARDNRALLLVFISLLVEFAGTGNELERRMKKLNYLYINFIKKLIEDGIKEGAVKKEIDPYNYSRLISSTMIGSHLQWYLHFSSDKAEDPEPTKRRALIQRNELLNMLLA
jgi:AcrR family transcriptional regulator